jgi:hypothetical protein
LSNSASDRRRFPGSFQPNGQAAREKMIINLHPGECESAMQPVRARRQFCSKTPSVSDQYRSVSQFRDHSNNERQTKIREYIRERTVTAFQCWIVHVDSTSH